MSHGKVTKGYMPDTGEVTVTGTFDPDDPEVDFARIIFLAVQGEGRDAAVARGEGSWIRDEAVEWSGTMERHGDLRLGPSNREFSLRKRTRGIAISVVVKPGRLLERVDEFPPDTESQEGDVVFDPPSIETLTWCADFAIVPSSGTGIPSSDPT